MTRQKPERSYAQIIEDRWGLDLFDDYESGDCE